MQNLKEKKKLLQSIKGIDYLINNVNKSSLSDNIMLHINSVKQKLKSITKTVTNKKFSTERKIIYELSHWVDLMVGEVQKSKDLTLSYFFQILSIKNNKFCNFYLISKYNFCKREIYE